VRGTVRERLATSLAVVTAMLTVSSVALAGFVDHESAAQAVSTDTLLPPTDPSTTHGPCTSGVSTSITVSWTATPSTWADGYEVLGSLVSGGPYTVVGTVTSRATTSHTVAGLAFLTTYHYVVRATKAGWRSSATSEASRTTLSSLCL
jgi:hypothetical protein